MVIEIVPITQKAARRWVYLVHRHLRDYPAGDVIRAALSVDGDIVAVGVAGRPCRLLDDGRTLAITRVASSAPITTNACSRLYGALRSAGLSLGYTRFFTYTRMDEPDGGEHDRPKRPRKAAVDPKPKRRWMWPPPK